MIYSHNFTNYGPYTLCIENRKMLKKHFQLNMFLKYTTRWRLFWLIVRKYPWNTICTYKFECTQPFQHFHIILMLRTSCFDSQNGIYLYRWQNFTSEHSNMPSYYVIIVNELYRGVSGFITCVLHICKASATHISYSQPYVNFSKR